VGVRPWTGRARHRFAATGILFAYTGFQVDPDQAGSMSDALQWLRQLPFGSLVYMVVAVGLAAFDIYNLVEARYRIVRGPSFSEMKRDGEAAFFAVTRLKRN
jgi:hypothetical protein